MEAELNDVLETAPVLVELQEILNEVEPEAFDGPITNGVTWSAW